MVNYADADNTIQYQKSLSIMKALISTDRHTVFVSDNAQKKLSSIHMLFLEVKEDRMMRKIHEYECKNGELFGKSTVYSYE